ncbi:hypothetical protein HYALB_00007927 [Hymenoscyphus albidus]|uniref:Uncharacterized protein n=1 Tax=Hymenoscyphus albidus TaxID=595503 RepID=A0A9N9LRA6_9HELO|nr:hypothetical protein HYALB_00007927 [Hymenoscyphus albidus]
MKTFALLTTLALAALTTALPQGGGLNVPAQDPCQKSLCDSDCPPPKLCKDGKIACICGVNHP